MFEGLDLGKLESCGHTSHRGFKKPSLGFGDPDQPPSQSQVTEWGQKLNTSEAGGGGVRVWVPGKGVSPWLASAVQSRQGSLPL